MGVQNDENLLFITQSIGNGLSAMASLFVMIVYLYAKPLQNYTFRLVFYLSLNNFIKAITNLIPQSISQFSIFLCQLDAYLFYFSSLSSLIWTFIIALTLYFIIIIKTINVEKQFKRYLIVSNILPYLLCMLPFISNSYQPAEVNCLLSSTNTGAMFRLILYYGPAFIIILLCILIYFKLYLHIKALCMNAMNKEALKLLYYPIILIGCVVPIFISRVIQYYDGDLNRYFFITTNFIWTLNGFFDALAYALNKTVLGYIKKKFIYKENTLIESEFIEIEG